MSHLDLRLVCDTRAEVDVLSQALRPLNIDIRPRGLTVEMRVHGEMPEDLDVDAVLAEHPTARVLGRVEIP